ncbi:MAG: tetratricopeptide repeat protein [Planctomycetes bacterium]|nr:tetratricopeptide repeat protein [Planctomycetota bacterium]
MGMDNDKFLETAIRLGVMTNASADNIRMATGPDESVVDAAKKMGLLSDAQIGMVLSAMFSQANAGAGRMMVEGEECVNHPGRMATHSCQRCGNPLCKDCGLPEDGFVYCSEECLEAYREERDAVFFSQDQAASRKKSITVMLTLLGILVAAIVGIVVYSKVSTYLRLSKADKLLQQAQQAQTGQDKVRLAKEALALNPKLDAARQLLPKAYYEAKDYKNAETEAKAQLEKQPNSPALKKILANSIKEMGRMDEAIVIFEELNAAGALMPLEKREIGLFLKDKGVDEKAIPLLEAAFASQDEDREVALVLGEYYLNQKNYDEASKYLDAVLQQTIKATDRSREANFVAKQGTLSKAMVLQATIANIRRDTNKLSALARDITALRSRKLSEGPEIVAVYEQWVPVADEAQLALIDSALNTLASGSAVPGISRVQGLLQGRKGNSNEAAILLEKSLLENDKDVVARNYLLDFYIMQGRYDDARKHLNALKEISKTGLKLEVAEAMVLNGEGNTEQALELSESILAKHPDNPEALAIAARVYMGTGRLEKAIPALDHLVETAPSVWSYFQGMLFSLRMGDKQGAVELARKTETMLAGVPTDVTKKIKRTMGIVTGEVDVSRITDPRLMSTTQRLAQKWRNPLDLLNQAVLSTRLVSYVTLANMEDNPMKLNTEYAKVGLPAYSGRAISDPFAKKFSGPIAEGFQEGFLRLMAFLELNMPTAEWRNRVTGIKESYQTESARLNDGSGQLAAMLKALREASLYCYQANRYPKSSPDKPVSSVALLKNRYAIEEALVDEDQLPTLYARHALECLVLASTTVENGALGADAMAVILRDDANDCEKADNGLEQLMYHMYSMAKAVAVLKEINDATVVAGILKQTFLNR